jgi:hypothetical protein
MLWKTGKVVSILFLQEKNNITRYAGTRYFMF